MELEKLQSAKKLFFIALGIDIAVTAISAVSAFWQIGILKDIQAELRSSDSSLLSTLKFWDSFALLMILTTIGVGVGLLKWLGNCYGFAKDTLHATGFKQEGWIAAGWIIPILNIFKPYQVINEIYKIGSTSYGHGDDWKKENASGLLLIWWLFWAVTHFLMWTIGKEMFKKSLRGDLTLNQVMNAYEIQIWSCVISIVVAGLWFAVANLLTGRLIARATVDSVPQQQSFSNQTPMQSASSISQQDRAVKPIAVEVATYAPMPNIKLSNEPEKNMENLEDWAYEKVADELESGKPDKAVWTKAFAQSGGDDKQTRVLYIQLRVEKLITLEKIRSRIENERKEREELERKEAEKKECELQEMLARLSKNEKILYGRSKEEVTRLEVSDEGREFLNWCSWGFKDKVVAAVEKNPLFLIIASDNGNTGLHWSVIANQASVASFLIEKGSSPLAKNKLGETPLSIAKAKGKEELIQLLSKAPV